MAKDKVPILVRCSDLQKGLVEKDEDGQGDDGIGDEGNERNLRIVLVVKGKKHSG